ncbi:MAG: thioether cross-link-forming SCIFF peptide maturase [Clostridiales bacterium]|nr:thioether cross-link-forming SCIFF peptide maturase [Clostridiales bacterium]MCF8022500.1 thioether cross-link-forming SCIFF peptide maturase [Clostridiales bacterium]
MIHQFTFDGINIVLDVHSGSLHMVDELTSKILELYPVHNENIIKEKLSCYYDVEQIDESIEEIKELMDAGTLFCCDEVGPTFSPEDNTIIKAMCLHLAHDCNLRCRYCFAGQGPFGMDRTIMSYDVGKKALDFLMEASGSRKHIEVDFFGGEPLLNFEVMKQLVEYGNSIAYKYGKKVKYTVTTNCVLLKGEIKEFIGQKGMDIVLSLDGRPEVQNSMRPFISGRGSYDIVSKNIVNFLNDYNNLTYYVRGTFTRHNLDFASDVMHMAELGLESLSVEPVVGGFGEDYALQEEDLPQIYTEYERLTRKLLEIRRKGSKVRFFHFNVPLDGGPCLKKRLSNCGAGNEYVAVTPQGEIYPCHQFVGKHDFKLGDISSGILNKDIMNYFRNAHVYNKENCPDCWAKFFCSGGCHANAYEENNTIYKPHSMGCKLMKKRLECALYLKVREMLDKQRG